jgi:Arc/MetJ-type ribon-helix-helix transcriptional regulator
MDSVILPPELQQFAAAAIAAGRYRDMDALLQAGVSLIQRYEAERAAFVASLEAAEAEADRVGWASLEQVDATMRAAISAAARRRA